MIIKIKFKKPTFGRDFYYTINTSCCIEVGDRVITRGGNVGIANYPDIAGGLFRTNMTGWWKIIDTNNPELLS